MKDEDPATSPIPLSKCDELMKRINSGSITSDVISAAQACYMSHMVERPKVTAEVPHVGDDTDVAIALCKQDPMGCLTKIKAAKPHPIVSTKDAMQLMTGLKQETIDGVRMGRFTAECPDGIGCLVECAGPKPCRLREIEKTGRFEPGPGGMRDPVWTPDEETRRLTIRLEGMEP